MQCAVIEFARNVLGWSDADSTEFNPETAHAVIDLMPGQRNVVEKGGTMRLGSYPCRFRPDSRSAALYGTTETGERHRHRYEFNPAFRENLAAAGLAAAGTSPDDSLVEVVELRNDHPYFIGCQFHPEFKSRPRNAHPLFNGLIAAALRQKGE